MVWVFILALTLYCVLQLAIAYSSNSLDPYVYYNKNLLGLSLMYTGIVCGVLVFLLSDVKIFFKKSLNAILLVVFIVSIYLFINESSALNLFFVYELFLLPSFYLVYKLSPNRRSTIASIYFLT